MPIWGEHRRGSVGWPNFGMEIKIVDDKRREVATGETGEIAIKGEPGISLFREYCKNPEATAKDLVEGWFYSGDSGKVDEDGYVYFVDRKKDMIKRAAENISAPEVERVINDHPAVLESAVIAVPDPVRDEAVMALVRLKEGCSANVDELTQFCRGKMAKFKVPEFWLIQGEEFPKTSIGKIRKNIIRSEILKDWDPTLYKKPK
jgi:crotonobetaine/carnitine-CoA ligase